MSYFNPPKRGDRLADVPSLTQESRSAECRKHKKQRLKKFLQAFPILDASGKEVGIEYECLSESLCATNAFSSSITLGNIEGATAAPAALVDGIAAQEALRRQMNGEKTSAVEGGEGAQQAPKGPRAPSRYYDMGSKKEADGPKVCFNCGLQGHEKPACPNKFCFTCHNLKHDDSVCETPEWVSPFSLGIKESVQREFLSMVKDDLEDVKCLVCGKEGSLDCCRSRLGNKSKAYQVSCSFCATKGHHAFNCPSRMPDRWNKQLARLFPEECDQVQGQGTGSVLDHSTSSGGGFGGAPRSGGGACYNCGKEGHLSRDCLEKRRGGYQRDNRYDGGRGYSRYDDRFDHSRRDRDDDYGRQKRGRYDEDTTSRNRNYSHNNTDRRDDRYSRTNDDRRYNRRY